MLKAALIAVGSVIGVVVLAVVAVGVLVGVASVTDAPVIFLGTGLGVWGVGLAAVAWVLARGQSHRRRVQLALATGIIGAALGGLAISLPMGDPPLPAAPVAGMASMDLPRGLGHGARSRLLRAMQNAELVYVRDAGHSLYVEQRA